MTFVIFGKHYRYVVLFLLFMVNICQMLVQQNMIFAVQRMIRRSRNEGGPESYANEGICYRSSTNETGPSGAFDWNDKVETRLLSLFGIGIMGGTGIALFIYHYFYLRMVLSLCLITSGLLTIFTPWIAQHAGPDAVILSRFIIGLYMGITTPCVNLACSTWYR